MMEYLFDFSSCTLCPKECRADRKGGRAGICGASNKIICARASLHQWEEPCLSGDTGSGTVFFSGCSLNCVFCQNREISHKTKGFPVSEERLLEIFFELKDAGAKNINLVTAGHFLPLVLPVIKKAKEEKIGIPFVYNSSGYEKASALKYCEGLIDIYLPDFKYWDKERAGRYSNANDYPDVAKSAIAEMVRQQPICEFDSRGLMTRGVIIRHLLLPEGLRDAKNILKYLYLRYGDSVYLSVMSQYTPFGEISFFPELMQKVSENEYNELIDYALSLGIENAFIQEGESADESFIPDFSGQGIVK